MGDDTYVERFIMRSIEKIDSDTSMDIKKSLMLMDIKELLEEVIGYSSCSFQRLMNFYDNKTINNLERREVVNTIFNKLEWVESGRDVINSFWMTFKTGVVISSQYELYTFNDNNYADIRNGKKKFANKYLGKANYDAVGLQEYANATRNHFEFDRIASTYHCVANFMPCPRNHFNEAKGTCYVEVNINNHKRKINLVNDYFPLMIDFVQKAKSENLYNNEDHLLYKFEESGIEYLGIVYYEDYSKNQNVPIKRDMIDEWYKWLSKEDNITEFALEDYYYIDEYNEIKGKPLFHYQSLSYPIPKSRDEVKECISEIIKRINDRATSMAKKIK